MKIDTRFPLQVGITLVVAGAIGGYPLLRYGSSEVISGVILGSALSTVNVLLGYIAIEFSFEKSYTVFVRTVIGGMGVRLVLMLGLLALLISVLPGACARVDVLITRILHRVSLFGSALYSAKGNVEERERSRASDAMNEHHDTTAAQPVTGTPAQETAPGADHLAEEAPGKGNIFAELLHHTQDAHEIEFPGGASDASVSPA